MLSKNRVRKRIHTMYIKFKKLLFRDASIGNKMRKKSKDEITRKTGGRERIVEDQVATTNFQSAHMVGTWGEALCNVLPSPTATTPVYSHLCEPSPLLPPYHRHPPPFCPSLHRPMHSWLGPLLWPLSLCMNWDVPCRYLLPNSTSFKSFLLLHEASPDHSL